MSATQPIRNKQQVRELAEYYLKRGELRNHLLIVMGVHTALRISDLLRLTWNDVYDFERNRFRDNIEIVEKKTKKRKLVTLNKTILTALHLCLQVAKYGEHPINRSDCLIKSRKGTGRAISRIQAYRLIRAAAEALGFHNRVSCHSLRKTFGYHAWKNGVSPAVIMEIYNHSDFAVTRRYLGVTQDDKDAVFRKLAEVI